MIQIYGLRKANTGDSNDYPITFDTPIPMNYAFVLGNSQLINHGL